jgi:hypothetical protein
VAHHIKVLLQPSSSHKKGVLAQQPIVRVVDFKGNAVENHVFHIDAIPSPMGIGFDAYGGHAITSDKGVAMFHGVRLDGVRSESHKLRFHVDGLIDAYSNDIALLPCPGKTVFSAHDLLCQCGPGSEAVFAVGAEAGSEPLDCKLCSKGTYHSSLDVAPCLDCPAGFTTAGEGASAASACDVPMAPTAAGGDDISSAMPATVLSTAAVLAVALVLAA